MNCEHFAVIVHELARPETSEHSLDLAAREAAKEHAGTCEACAAKLAEAQLLALALDATAEDSAEFAAPERAKTALLTKFREYQRLRHEAVAAIKQLPKRAGRRWLEWSALGAAAVLLLAAGIWNHGHQTPANPGSGAAIMQSAPTGGEQGEQANKAQPNGKTASAEENAANENLADFVAVPYADSLQPDDAAFIVRVEMPRSALGELGYPVDLTHSTDMVEADLLVGEDGLPRAVRVVQ